MKLRSLSMGLNNAHETNYDDEKTKFKSSIYCFSTTRRRLFILWFLSLFVGLWVLGSFKRMEKRLINENADIELSVSETLDSTKYNRNMPIIFVGGVPRSGTTLMRAMLDAHPLIRCGEETRIIPRMIDLRNAWLKIPIENERLENAGINSDVIDAALSAFMLEIIVKHGKPAQHMCNKDPLVLKHSAYVKNLFPNAKFILMIRDGRASVHSIITRHVTIKGFDLNDWSDCFTKWNRIIENMYNQCMDLGPDVCMPVYYEQLVLHPKDSMKKILKFLDIPWNEAVLHHEKFIGDEVSLSKVEFSTDQVIKPVNLEALTSWVGNIPG